MMTFYDIGQEKAKAAIRAINSPEQADTIIWAFYENLMDDIVAEHSATDRVILEAHKGYCDLIKSSKFPNTLTGDE